MKCVSCGLRAGYNRVVVDLVSGREHEGFCRNCEFDEFGQILSKSNHRADSCILCRRDGHYGLVVWRPYRVESGHRIICDVGILSATGRLDSVTNTSTKRVGTPPPPSVTSAVSSHECVTPSSVTSTATVTPDELTVESASVYPYSDELIVELTATDKPGDLVVVSYQFQYESGTDAVEPKQSVDTAFGDEVSTALAANGYQWVPESGE